MNPLTQFKNITILPVLIALTLVCFALASQARAVCQEGCLTNDNTALGDDALISNTTGFQNTATGFNALFNNTTGSLNTANGVEALFNNRTSFGNTAVGAHTLFNNDGKGSNTAVGIDALFSNTIGWHRWN